jgi:hypothetical protein
MATFIDRCVAIVENMAQGVRQVPAQLTIPSDHIDQGSQMGNAFKPDTNYFQVRINEVFLSYDRKWFVDYDPMVFVVTEFTYDKQDQAVPFVVGPMMMQKYGQKLPKGMIFADTKVSGLHPYRGGEMTLSVILSSIKVSDMARNVMQLVEGAASVLDFATALSSYVKVAGVVLDGVEQLMGLSDTIPLVGMRKGLDPSTGSGITPTYFVLINTPESAVDASQLWVKNNQLFKGQSMANCVPFRDADYVLYSLTQAAVRDDITTLPFYPLWEMVAQEATVAKDDTWQTAKANMASLFQSMALSPDLTLTQAQSLADDYIGKMQALHKQAVSIASLGAAGMTASAVTNQATVAKAVSILNL